MCHEQHPAVWGAALCGVDKLLGPEEQTVLALGLAATLLVVPAMRGLLFGVTWSDPLSFAVGAVIILVVAAIAGLLPAHRATRLDPSSALRGG